MPTDARKTIWQLLENRQIDAHVATGRQTLSAAAQRGWPAQLQSRVAAMAAKLHEAGYSGPDRLRKQVVELVFGQIKQARGFRQFLQRGLVQVQSECSLNRTVPQSAKTRRDAPKAHPLGSRWRKLQECTKSSVPFSATYRRTRNSQYTPLFRHPDVRDQIVARHNLDRLLKVRDTGRRGGSNGVSNLPASLPCTCTFGIGVEALRRRSNSTVNRQSQ